MVRKAGAYSKPDLYYRDSLPQSINLFYLLSCNNCFGNYICVMTYQITSFPTHVVSEIIRNVVTSISFEEAQQLRLVNRQTL
jgi:hypothetical protein